MALVNEPETPPLPQDEPELVEAVGTPSQPEPPTDVVPVDPNTAELTAVGPETLPPTENVPKPKPEGPPIVPKEKREPAALTEEETPDVYGPRPIASVTQADIKSENTYLAGRLARSMSLLDDSDGGTFAREYGLRPEAAGMASVEGMVNPADREAAMQSLMETRTKSILDEIKEIPEEILRGAVYRNLQSLEDYANALAGGQARFNIIDDFEDEESIVADVAEYIPLIAASFYPGTLIPRAIGWASRLPGAGRLIGMTAKELPKWGKWISHMATFNSLVAIKEMVKEDNPPEHKYGPVVDWIGTQASLPVHETAEQRKLRHENYTNGSMWKQFGDQFVANAPGDLLIEAAAFGTGRLLKAGYKRAKGLLVESDIAKNLESGVTTMEKANIERIKTGAEKVEAADEYVLMRKEVAQAIEKVKGANLSKAQKEMRHQLLLKYKDRLDTLREERRVYDQASFKDNLNVIQAAAENAMLHTRAYKKTIKGDRLVVQWDPEKSIAEKIGRKEGVNVEKVLDRVQRTEDVRTGKIPRGAKPGPKPKAEGKAPEGKAPEGKAPEGKAPEGDELKIKYGTQELGDILPESAFAGISRRKVGTALRDAFEAPDDTAENILKSVKAINQYAGYLDDDMIKVMSDPTYKGNIVAMLGVARHNTDAKIIRELLGKDMSNIPRAYKFHDAIQTFKQLRDAIDPKDPDNARLVALLDKQDAVAKVHKMFASEAGASLQAVDTFKVKDAFFLGTSLGNKLEYLSKLSPEKQVEAMDFYEAVAKADIDLKDVQFYRMNPAWNFEGMLDLSQRSALNNYLGDTALLATKVGNILQTLKLGYKNTRRFGTQATYDDIREGFKTFGRMAQAKGKSYDYWKQTWDDLTGVTRFKTLEEHHIEGALRQRTAASKGEKVVNAVTGWRFKLMEMIDMTTTAFNSPMLTRDAIQKLTYADAEEALTFKQSMDRTYETARRLREAILNPGSDDAFLDQYHRIRNRENARLSYRVKLSSDETTSKTWVGAVSQVIQKVGQRQEDDGAIMLLGRHFANARLLVFANTFMNIVGEGKRAFWDGIFLLHKKWVKKNKHFTREEQETLFETEAAYLLGGILTAGTYLSDDLEYEPLRGNEDLMKTRQLEGLRVRPTHYRIGGTEVPSSVIGHSKIGMVQMKHAIRGIERLMAIKDTADLQGNVELSAAAYKAAVNFAMDVTPHNMVMNISEVFASLDEQGEGKKLRRYLAKEAGALAEDSIPLAKDIRTWREGPFGDLKGKPVKGRTTDPRPSESTFPSWDAYTALTKSVDYLSDRASNAFGHKSWEKRNMFGMLVKTPSQATADETGAGIKVLQVFTSRFKGTTAGRDTKYDALMKFTQRYGMYGKGHGTVERDGIEQGGVKRFTFGAGSVRYLSTRKRHPGHMYGMEQVRQTERGSMGIPPHKRSMMLGMVGGYADVWENFYERVEKGEASGVVQPMTQNTPEGEMKTYTAAETVRSARRAQRDLWRKFGGKEGEPMIDVVNRLGTAPWSKVQRYLFDYHMNARQYNNFYLGPAENFEARRVEDRNLARVMAMSLFYEKSWELTRKVVGAVDPDFQDRSEALIHHEDPKLRKELRMKRAEKRRQKRDTKIP